MHFGNSWLSVVQVTMILNEALRLYPPVASLHRIVHKETKLGNLIILVGVEIVIPTILVHHDYELWGEMQNSLTRRDFQKAFQRQQRAKYHSSHLVGVRGYVLVKTLL